MRAALVFKHVEGFARKFISGLFFTSGQCARAYPVEAAKLAAVFGDIDDTREELQSRNFEKVRGRIRDG